MATNNSKEKPSRSISMASIMKKMKDSSSMSKLMISSDPEIRSLMEELVLDRLAVSLTRSLDDVLTVAKRKIANADHFRLALSSLSL